MSLFGNMLTGSLDNYPRTIKALREYMAAEAEMWHEFEEMNERAMRDAIKMFAPDNLLSHDNGKMHDG